ncbi:MAG: S8 family serine peptidase [Planctomycetota bacterium]
MSVRIVLRTSLCTSLALSAALAQSPQRVAVPDGTPVAPDAANTPQPNTQAVAIAGLTDTQIDDLPDFTPTRLAGAADATVRQDVQCDPYVLAFLGGSYKPQRGIDPRLIAAMAATAADATYGYIMIEGRLNHPAKIAQLRALGVEIYAPHTWQSFAAKIPFTALAGLQSLPYVRWVGYAQPAQKVDPLLARQLLGAKPDEGFAVHVTTFASDVNPASEWRLVGGQQPTSQDPNAVEVPVQNLVPNGPFHKALTALGFEFHNYTDTTNVHVFDGVVTAAQLERIVALDFVTYVEPPQRHELSHDQSQAMIGTDRVRGTYHGQPITVGIIDSGIDFSPLHNDLGGKAMVGWRTGGTTAFDDGCTHGTHVAGTIFGRGVANARYRGAAPNCGNGGAGQRVFVGRYFFDACDAQGTVSTLYSALGSDYVEGSTTNPKPRCINNSWGAPPSTTWSGTESGARTLDDVVQNNLQNYIFAAGNSGGGTNSPGSAKNALTVGSLDDFGSNVGHLSSFSRSAVSDGRQKPEVCAPGNVVTSVAAGTTTGYSNKSGTSMATPHVTGALTGLIQHYGFLDYSPPAQQVVAIASSEVQGVPTRTTGDGWGCINAYKMHWTSRTGWSVVTNHTHIDTTGEWFYADIAVPANIDSLDVVWGWTEPAAASGATVARRSSIRVSVDAPPYSSTGNTGEYTAFLGSNNKWKVTGLSVATFAGQTVRLKLYGDSVSGLCRVSGLLFWHIRDTQTPEPTLSVSKSANCVQPSSTFTMTGAWAAASTGDEFDNSRMWPVVPSFTITQLQRTTADSIVQTYTGTSHPSYPWPALNSNGMTTGQGTSRSAVWTLRAPATSNTYTLRVDGSADYRSSATASASTTICVDGLNPNAPTSLRSSTHTTTVWSNNPNITFLWTPGTDNGCAGVADQQYARGNGSCPTPSTVTSAGTTSRTESGLASVTSANGYYFAVRSRDNCGNVGNAGCVGPFLIDTVVPTVNTVSINSGATYTTSLNVSVAVTAADSHSGVAQVRLSSDNATWSAWQAFTSPVAYNLSSNGGNANEGNKTVYVQVRDQAGNVSSSRNDSIQYLRLPAITSSTPTDLPNVTEGFFRLAGSDFVGVTEVQFDGAAITSTNPDNWDTGYFRIVNDSTLDVYPPQARPTGGHTLRLRNAAGLSNVQNVSLSFPTSLTLRTHSSLTAGANQTIFTSSGPSGGAFASYLALSPSNLPSTLPGVVSFQIGNSFSSLTLLSVAFPHNAATRAATIGPLPTNPSMLGAILYYQALTFAVPSLPLPTTNSWQTIYH